ncbi:MAG: DEAD/DEAH box helicase [Pseudomonadota bacterium]
MKNRFYHNRKSRRTPKNIPGIKPGADPSLKKVFSKIGVPEESPFKPDDFQIQALEAIQKSDCLVTAPTGSGKTWIAETAISNIYEAGGKAWYASPLKALSNSIHAGFSQKFGSHNVGILTGDRKENTNAPIIIGTTEILRNHLYDAMHQGENLTTDLVILDEAHFLGDEERGVVWEEIMIYLPTRIPLLMLSATIGNTSQISGWLEHVRKRKCFVVEETNRPVPLFPLFLHPNGMLSPLISAKPVSGKTVIHKKVAPHIGSKQFLSAPGKLPPMGEIIGVLKKYHLLPAIFFMKSRMDCDMALNLCTEENLNNDPDRKERLSRRLNELLAANDHIKTHKQRWQLEHMGVASHHSGQLPAWKIVIETLMAEGILDAIFATSTVAAGVNFPARTVVILNSDRFNGIEFQPLSPTEFHQMTGRAGRRGKDNIGFALTLPGKYMDLRLMVRLIHAQPSPIYSQIRINFSMVLNLLLSHTPGQIRELLEKSFAAYQLMHTAKSGKTFPVTEAGNFLWNSFQQHLDFLKEHHYVSPENALTQDGEWASKLRIDHPLMIAEAFRLGIFPESNPALLAAITASFVNERENVDDHLQMDQIPKQLINRLLIVKKSLRSFNQNLHAKGFPSKLLYISPAKTIYDWAMGNSWEKVVKTSGLAEGDLARLILRTSDNLRHFRNLFDVFPKIAETSGKAIETIIRDPLIS